MIVMYTTHCPRCKILEAKLKEKRVEYKEITDVNEIMQAGFMTVPVLVVENNPLDFVSAVKWVNDLLPKDM